MDTTTINVCSDRVAGVDVKLGDRREFEFDVFLGFKANTQSESAFEAQVYGGIPRNRFLHRPRCFGSTSHMFPCVLL